MEKDRFQFSLEGSVETVRNRCLDAIEGLGWKIRHDLTQGYQITCYVSIADLLPQAPVYSISLYPEESTVHIVLVAASDHLSQSHARIDLPKLRSAIEQNLRSFAAVQTEMKCFISYRRYDSIDVVGRIYDRLVAAYGADHIFKDVNNIPIGADFRKILNEAVDNCSVVLVIIGRDWLTVTDENQQRRLDDPADFVRIEIEAALKRDKSLVPVLVRDAKMPRVEDMPESLKELVYRHAVQVRSDPDFHHDMDRLIEAMNNLLSS